MTARRLLATLAAAALAAAVAPPAGAAPADTWDGRCDLTGALSFDPPMSAVPKRTTYADAATGACTGTLNGAAIAAEPVEMIGEGEGTIGCLVGASTTWGTLRFTRGTADGADDVVLPYRSESRGGLTQFVSVANADSGVTATYVNFLPHGDEATLRACETGTLTSMRYDATAFTVAR